MILHQYDLALPVAELVRETELAVAGWNWNRGAHGHALPLAAYEDLHPFRRYTYQNHPCTGRLRQLPRMRQLFDSLECEKISFRLLRRAPGTAYGWHTDRWKGPGVVRFQIPLISEPSAFLVLTDYEHSSQVRGAEAALDAGGYEKFSAQNEGHVCRHQPAPGMLLYFDTTRVHTLVNPGPGERITLSFDLLANDWLRRRFPAIEAEIASSAGAELPVASVLERRFGYARTYVHSLRNRARSWFGRDEGAE